MASSLPGPMFPIDVKRLPRLLCRVVERYIRAFSPDRIVLFGSYAKGNSHTSSDLDLLVVADLDGDLAFYLRRARQLAADCFPPVDVLFATPEEVDSAGTAKSPFLQSILERGIVVYRRDPESGKGTDGMGVTSQE